MRMIAVTQEWAKRPERSNPAVMKFAFSAARWFGRDISRLLLHPIALYFLITARRSRRASKQFLTHALGRVPTALELYRHHFWFAACLLDRLFLLAGRRDLFDLRIFGEDVITDVVAKGAGCILMGAHVGSFDAVRAVAEAHGGLRVVLLMYQENAKKIAGELNAIDPSLADAIIGLGRHDSMLRVWDELEAGTLIGILADRSFGGEPQQPQHFLGKPAKFPSGPFRLAKLLRRPVVLMLGLYRGGNRYDVHFEMLAEWPEEADGSLKMSGDDILRRYATALERHVHREPFNWFNFFEFWG